MDREDQGMNGRPTLLKAGDSVDAGHSRQVDIHQRQIWLGGGRVTQGMLHRRAGATAGETRSAVNQSGQTLTKAPVILHQQHLNLRTRGHEISSSISHTEPCVRSEEHTSELQSPMYL